MTTEPLPHLSEQHIATLAALVVQGAHASGAALATRLGVTRARVSQCVRDLNAAGARIESGRSGYRAAFPGAMLDAAVCAAHTSFAVMVMPVVDSTNAEAQRRLHDFAATPGFALLAEWQSSGRGRRGRSWASAPGGSILLSLVWQFSGGAASLAGLSLLVGLSLVQALESLGIKGAQLKWPNDVLWRGQKIAGVLVELSGDALGPTTAVIGVGLNVHLPPAARAALDQAVTDLAQIAPHIAANRNAIVNALLRTLQSNLTAFSALGFAPFAPNWQARHAHAGKRVRARLPDGRTIDGEARGIEPNGALMLQTAHETITLNSAEISVRAKA